MFWPSEDHCGPQIDGLANKVSCTGFDPSLSHTQISLAPDRSDTNAIFFPSGENIGAQSGRVDAMNCAGADGSEPGSRKSIRQMLVSYFPYPSLRAISFRLGAGSSCRPASSARRICSEVRFGAVARMVMISTDLFVCTSGGNL